MQKGTRSERNVTTIDWDKYWDSITQAKRDKDNTVKVTLRFYDSNGWEDAIVVKLSSKSTSYTLAKNTSNENVTFQKGLNLEYEAGDVYYVRLYGTVSVKGEPLSGEVPINGSILGAFSVKDNN